MLEKAASLRQGYGSQGTPLALSAVALAQAGRAFVMPTYCEYAPRAKAPAALLDGPF